LSSSANSKEIITTASSSVGGSHETLSTNLNQVLQDLQTTTTELSSTLQTTLSEKTQESLNKNKNTIEAFKEQTTAAYNEGTQLITKTGNELAANWSEMTTQFQTALSKSTESSMGSIISAFEKLTTDLDELKLSFTNQISNNSEALKNDLNQKIEENLNTTREQLSTVFTQNEEATLTSLQTAMNTGISNIDETRASLETAVESIKTNLINYIQDWQQSSILSLNQSTDHNKQSFSESLSSSITSVKDSFTKAANNTTNSYGEFIQSAKDALIQNLDLEISSLQSETSNCIGSLQGKAQEMDESVKKVITDFQENTASGIMNSETTAKEKFAQFEELNSKMQELLQNLLISQTEFTDNISAVLQEHQTAYETTIQGTQSNMKEKIDRFQTDGSEKIQSSIDQFKEQISSLKDIINNMFQGFVTGLTDIFTNIENNLQETKTSIGETITATTTQNQESLKNATEGADTTNITAITNSKNAIEEFVNDGLAVHSEHLENTKAQIREPISATKDIIDEGLQSTQAKAFEIINNTQATSIGAIKEIHTQIDQTLSQISSGSQKVVEEINTQTKESIGQSFTEVQQLIEDKTKAVFEAEFLKQTVASSEELRHILTDLAQKVREHKRPDEQTQFIHTKQAILDKIDEWLKTAKAGVTLIVPSYEDLPLDTLKEVPVRRRVLVYTNMGDMRWAKQFADHTNLRFHQLETGPQMPPIIAADREKEEILFAPANMKAPIALLSEEDPYIEAVAKLMSQYMGMGRVVETYTL
ncbi:MAG: hypothetical protein ACFFCQ_02195, partial [Promethearchaeota archaeon]